MIWPHKHPRRATLASRFDSARVSERVRERAIGCNGGNDGQVTHALGGRIDRASEKYGRDERGRTCLYRLILPPLPSVRRSSPLPQRSRSLLGIRCCSRARHTSRSRSRSRSRARAPSVPVSCRSIVRSRPCIIDSLVCSRRYLCLCPWCSFSVRSDHLRPPPPPPPPLPRCDCLSFHAQRSNPRAPHH